MADIKETKNDMHEGQAEILDSKVLANSELMNDAFDGENREHEESLWSAAKRHPWVCFWAFTMCFTIVSFFWAILGINRSS